MENILDLSAMGSATKKASDGKQTKEEGSANLSLFEKELAKQSGDVFIYNSGTPTLYEWEGNEVEIKAGDNVLQKHDLEQLLRHDSNFRYIVSYGSVAIKKPEDYLPNKKQKNENIP